MTPTVGRIVIFRQPVNEEPVNGMREHPAIITRVWSNDLVNLHVFYDGAPSAARTSVVRADDVDLTGYTWHWPERAA